MEVALDDEPVHLKPDTFLKRDPGRVVKQHRTIVCNGGEDAAHARLPTPQLQNREPRCPDCMTTDEKYCHTEASMASCLFPRGAESHVRYVPAFLKTEPNHIVLILRESIDGTDANSLISALGSEIH